MRWIGAACGAGAQDRRTEFGPEHFFAYAEAHGFSPASKALVRESPGLPSRLSALDGLADFNVRLKRAILEASEFRTPSPLLVVGGDHSCAVGTWSSFFERTDGDLGLLWMDAHLDAHTPQTTESGAIHGMPVAVLLGSGPQKLTSLLSRHFQPDQIVLFGVRSFEKSEMEFIKHLGVRVYLMEEIQSRGFDITYREAMDHLRKWRNLGISLDLDVLDPGDAPGVGSPERNGLKSEEVLQAFARDLKAQNLSRLCALEITEYNPAMDLNDLTVQFMFSCAQLLIRPPFGPD